MVYHETGNHKNWQRNGLVIALQHVAQYNLNELSYLPLIQFQQYQNKVLEWRRGVTHLGMLEVLTTSAVGLPVESRRKQARVSCRQFILTSSMSENTFCT